MTSPTSTFAPVIENLPESRSGRRVVVEKDPLHWLRLAIYAYFLLWIFEGALRKWILPSLSSPLLVVRDPLLLYIYFEAVRQKVFKLNGLTIFLLILGALSTIVSLGLVKAPPLKVVIFGIHANFLHLPLIFLLPQIITYTDVRKMGRIILQIAPFMAVLVALQFLSPSGARLNTGAGGEGKMLETALDRIRPSGTFSFTNGLAAYTALLTAFLFHHLLEKNIFKKITFLLACPSLLILVVMSGSRTVVALVALEVLAVAFIWFLKPRFLQSSIKLVAIGAAVIFVVGSFGALRLGMDVIVTRFTSSGGLKQGFLVRILGEFTKPIDAATRAEAGGVGIGMGTNAASSMMYKMLRFNLGESESDRIIMEMGPYLGLPYLLWRFAVLLFVAKAAIVTLKNRNNTLPIFLTTACANDLVMGQFGQTTVIGFAVLASGFALAAVQRRDDEGLLSYEGFDEKQPTLKRANRLLYSKKPTSFIAPGPIISSANSPSLNKLPTYADRLRMEAEAESIESVVLVKKTPRKKLGSPNKTRSVPTKKK